LLTQPFDTCQSTNQSINVKHAKDRWMGSQLKPYHAIEAINKQLSQRKETARLIPTQCSLIAA